MNRLRIQVSGTTLLMAALFLLILPLKWLIAMLVAALWHEACHLAAVKMCGGKISRVTVSENRTVMEAESLTPVRELMCVLAGPLGGFLLLLFIKWFPRTAVCCAVHSLYNLIPIYPLDGGRALRIVTSGILPVPRAGNICLACEQAVKALIVLLAVWAALFLRMGLMPLLIAGILLIKTKSEKSLAN